MVGFELFLDHFERISNSKNNLATKSCCIYQTKMNVDISCLFLGLRYEDMKPPTSPMPSAGNQ